MQFVIGIDGGGTKTLVKIANLEGKLIFCAEGGPANINSTERHTIQSTIADLIIEGLKAIGGDPPDCRMLCMGTAGAGRPAEKVIFENIFRNLGFSDILITDDAHTALYGGIDSDEGVILISGTGSICYGRNKRGETRRAGGWGYIIGDEGSGYDIGLQAIKHTARSIDKRDGESLLSSMILKRLGISGMDELIGLIYRSGNGRSIIAELAPVVDEAYINGDIYAKGILDNSVSELFKCVKAVIDGMEFSRKQIYLAFSGSVLKKCRYISGRLKDVICSTYPEITVIDAKNDAAWGAVLMALAHCAGRPV